MTATDTRPTDDEALTAEDRAAIERALAVSEAGAKRLHGIALTIEELAALIDGLDDEVQELTAAGRVAEALGTARFNAFERQHPFA